MSRVAQKSLVIAAGVALALLLLQSFALDCLNLAGSGSIDLRNRVTGARLMLEDMDPYHYKWREGDPPEYCDPYNNLALPINKCTVTPTLLLATMPVAALKYRRGQEVWLVVQWLLLLGTAAVWMRVAPAGMPRWMIAFVVAGFTFTVAWRHHADRGQAYVVMLFLFSCWVVMSRGEIRRWGFWAGVIAGVLIALRPPFVLLLAPFIVMKRRGQIVGALTGLVISAGLPLVFHDACWSEYREAMQTWSEVYREGPSATPRPPVQSYPALIEGMPIDLLARFNSIPFADTSLFALFRNWTPVLIPVWPVLFTLIVLFAAWCCFARSKGDDTLLIGLSAWAFLTDIFLPAYRNSYNDVMILGLAAFLVVRHGVKSKLLWLLLVAWPAGWFVMEMLPRKKWLINMPTTIMIAVAAAAVVWSATKGKEAERCSARTD